MKHEAPTDLIHHQLLEAFSHSNRTMLDRTRKLGLKPGQPKVLEYVIRHEGCTQRDIARACVMDKSTATGILARMEEEGLIERYASPADRRIATVHLTEAGRAAATRVLAICDEVDAIAWRGMEAQERRTLARLLRRVVGNLSEEGERA